MISNILIQLNMDYYCDDCDKTITLKPITNHPKSLTHIQYEKSFRKHQTIKNPYFFDSDKRINDYIIYHDKKLDFYLFKCDFKLVFKNFIPYIESHFHHNTTFINLKRYLLYWNEFFTERGHKFSHVNEMKVTTINDKENMTYERYIKQTIQTVELRLKVIIAKNPLLINSLNIYIY